MMETFFNVTQQCQIFLLSCVLGAFLALPFDIFRAVREIFPHKKVIIIIEDVIYVIFFAFCVFLFTVSVGRSEIRGFIFIGAFLGFVLYILTLGNIVIKVIRIIVSLCKKTIEWIFRKKLTKNSNNLDIMTDNSENIPL